MNAIFQQFTDIGLKRLFKFTLKKSIGQYLNDDLSVEQIEVNRATGKLEVKKLELNCQLINDILNNNNVPLTVFHGSIEIVQANYSLFSVFSDGLHLEVNNIFLKLGPREIVNSTNHIDKNDIHSAHFNYPDEELLISDEGRLGMDYISNWIEEAVLKLKITSNIITIEFFDDIYVEDNVSVKVQFENVSFAEISHGKDLDVQKLSKTICASNIGIFLNDKNREYEILSSTSLEIDLFDNHATFVSVNKLNIELCLETINALILILKGISSRNSRKEYDESEWITNRSVDYCQEMLGESSFFDTRPGPNFDSDVLLTGNEFGSSNFQLNLSINSITIRVSQVFESLLCTAQNLTLEASNNAKDEITYTKLTLDGFNVSRQRENRIIQFIFLESGDKSALNFSCDLVLFGSGMKVTLTGHSAPISVSLTNDFADIWEEFFLNFTEFNRSNESTNSFLEVSIGVPSFKLYILPGDENNIAWKNIFLCSSFWIFHPIERLKWISVSRSMALSDSSGGLYVDFRDICITMQHSDSNLYQKIEINEALFGCFLSSLLSDDFAVSDQCNAFFSNLITVSTIEISSQSMDCESNGDRLFRVDAENVNVEINKHQLDTFLSIINMLKSSDSTEAILGPPKYRFGFVLASKFSSISLCENEKDLIELFMESDAFMFSNLRESSGQIRQYMNDCVYIRDDPLRFCVAVKNALFELKFFDCNIDIRVCANDLLLFEVNALQHEKLVASNYDSTLDASLPRPIVSRTQWNMNQEAKLFGEYALNIQLNVETLSSSYAQLRAVQSLQVQIGLEDFCIEYYPSSVWFLRFVSFFTIHSPQQIIVALDNMIRLTIEKKSGIGENTTVLNEWSSVLRKYCECQHNVNMQPAMNYSVELTKVLVTVKKSLIRYFCQETQLLAIGNVDVLSLSTAVLSNNSSVNLKVLVEGLKLVLKSSTLQIIGNQNLTLTSDDDVGLDKIEILILIDSNNNSSRSTVNCNFGNCFVNCDIAKLRIMTSMINSLLACIDESRRSSENIIRKNKIFDEDGLLNVYYKHHQDELVDKVRFCDVDDDDVGVPILIDSALIDYCDDDLQSSGNDGQEALQETFLSINEQNDWIPDYESPLVNCDNDSILGSLLDCNDGCSIPEFRRPIVGMNKDDGSETLFSESEDNHDVHETGSVELKELTKLYIAGETEPPIVEHSNKLYSGMPNDDFDIMDEIWESKHLFSAEESNFLTQNEIIQSESKWYIPANEVEIFHDYVPVAQTEFASESEWKADEVSFQIVIHGDFTIKIFVGHNDLKGGEEEKEIVEVEKLVANAQNPEAASVNHDSSSLLIRIRRFTAKYVTFANTNVLSQPDTINASFTLMLHDFLLSFENPILGLPHKVLGLWINSSKKRDSTKAMVKLKVNGYGSNALEYRTQLELLPIRCYLDHNFVCCVKYFATILKQNTSKGDTKVSPLDIYFQAVSTNAFDVKLDYRATYLNITALRNGDFTELLNIFPIDCLELTLKATHFHGISGIESLGKMVVESWVKDIYENQFHKIISGTTPFKGISHIGSNLHNLFYIPINEFRSNKDVMKHISKSTKGLITTIARESLDVSHKFTKFVADTITDLASDESVTKVQQNHRKRNSLEEVKRQPKNFSEGLIKAYSSVQRECSDALDTIVAVPVHQYVRNGPKGVATTIARLLPIAVLKPIGGIVEGLSYTLLGLRNNVDPDCLQSDEDIWNVDFDFDIPH